MSRTFLPALIATLSLAMAPLPVLADKGARGNGHGAWGENGFCPPGLANRDPACVPPGQARHASRDSEERRPLAEIPDDWIRQVDDHRDDVDDAGAAIAIVGALMGLALLERADRERERDEPEPAAAAAPWTPPEVPVRPDWLALLAEPAPLTSPNVVEPYVSAEVPEATIVPQMSEPTPSGSSLIPPSPPMADDVTPTSDDLAEAFERAQASGNTGF